jgi:Fe-coproporphyrin III synthase
MVSVAEVSRRLATQRTHRIESLPVLALSVHSACNCRCVMCDIWKANSEKREIALADLEAHIDAIRALRVRRVMLTGGEPLLHANLWALCGRLRDVGVKVTLVTTGLLIARHVDAIAASLDEVVVSLDGPADVHDEIRRVPGAFAKIATGIGLLMNHGARPRTVARCVVQRRNHGYLVQAIEAIREIGVDRLSFLAADVSSAAFNRPLPWDDERKGEVAVSADQLPLLAASIREVEQRCGDALYDGFVVGGAATLWRIHDYYAALLGRRDLPRVHCNAPWISAVLEPGGAVRPCFFHEPYGSVGDGTLADALNTPSAIAFRRALRVNDNETCKRCVCTMSLPVWRDV